MNKQTTDRIPRILDFLDAVNFTTRKVFQKHKFVDRKAINWFDINTAALMSTMVDICAQNKSAEFMISRHDLAERSHVSPQSIRTRLDRMVDFGMLERKSEMIGHNQRSPTAFKLHPHLTTAIAKDARAGIRTEAAKYFSTVGMKRLTGGGELTDDENSKFEDLATRIETDKARKLRDTKVWRDNDRHFVTGAAQVWQYLQSYRGFGNQMPNWHGDDIAPTAAKERRELTKIFQQYGGRVTAMAWWVFVGGQPALDEKTGRPKFDINNPHVQFATVDKKPSQFTKHFNAILSDKTFIDMATISWVKTEPILQKWFGNILDVQPRSGADDSELVGFYIGQTNAILGELPNEISP